MFFTEQIGQTDTIRFLERKVGRAPHDLASSPKKETKGERQKRKTRLCGLLDLCIAPLGKVGSSPVDERGAA